MCRLSEEIRSYKLYIYSGASPGFGKGGQEFFSDLEICMSRSGMHFARGVRGHAPPPEKIFKMVQFDALWCIF